MKGKAMALTECPACKQQVSPQATACPACGQPLRSTPSGSNGADWLKAAGIVGLAWALPKVAKILLALVLGVALFYWLFA